VSLRVVAAAHLYYLAGSDDPRAVPLSLIGGRGNDPS